MISVEELQEFISPLWLPTLLPALQRSGWSEHLFAGLPEVSQLTRVTAWGQPALAPSSAGHRPWHRGGIQIRMVLAF